MYTYSLHKKLLSVIALSVMTLHGAGKLSSPSTLRANQLRTQFNAALQKQDASAMNTIFNSIGTDTRLSQADKTKLINQFRPALTKVQTAQAAKKKVVIKPAAKPAAQAPKPSVKKITKPTPQKPYKAPTPRELRQRQIAEQQRLRQQGGEGVLPEGERKRQQQRPVQPAVEQPAVVQPAQGQAVAPIVPVEVSPEEFARLNPAPSRPAQMPQEQPAYLAPQPSQLELDNGLIENARKGNLPAVEELLGQGASVVYVNPQGESALTAAIMNGKNDVVKRLIAAGARPTLTDIKDALQDNPAAMKEFGTPALTALLSQAQGDIAQALQQEIQSRGGKREAAQQMEAMLDPFHQAARDGNVRQLQAFIQEGYVVDAPDANGNTPLMLAAQSGQLKAVQALIKAGANPAMRNNNGETALAIAQKNNKGLIVGYFKGLPAAAGMVQAITEAMQSADDNLLKAAQNGDLDDINRAFRAGADVNAANATGKTALHIAAQRGDAPAIQALLQAGADMNAMDDAGSTPIAVAQGAAKQLLQNWVMRQVEREEANVKLIAAAKNGNIPAMDAALTAGASVNATSREGASALTVAVTNGHTDAVLFLLEHDAISPRLALAQAAVSNNPDMVIALLDYGMARNLWTAQELQPALQALPTSAVDSFKIKSLIQAAQDVLTAQENRESAARIRELKTVFDGAKAFFFKPTQPGAFRIIERADENKRLLDAAAAGDLEGARAALQDGADVNARTQPYETPLMRAVVGGDPMIVELLLSQPSIQVNATDEQNKTALMLAAQQGESTIVGQLLDAHANAALTDIDGQTALDMAANSGIKQMIQAHTRLAERARGKNIEEVGGEIIAGIEKAERDLQALYAEVSNYLTVGEKDEYAQLSSAEKVPWLQAKKTERSQAVFKDYTDEQIKQFKLELQQVNANLEQGESRYTLERWARLPQDQRETELENARIREQRAGQRQGKRGAAAQEEATPKTPKTVTFAEEPEVFEFTEPASPREGTVTSEAESAQPALTVEEAHEQLGTQGAQELRELLRKRDRLNELLATLQANPLERINVEDEFDRIIAGLGDSTQERNLKLSAETAWANIDHSRPYAPADIKELAPQEVDIMTLELPGAASGFNKVTRQEFLNYLNAHDIPLSQATQQDVEDFQNSQKKK